MPDRPSLDDFLSMTVKTACAISGFSKDTVYDLLNAGEVKSFTMGTRRFVDAASLRAYIARRSSEPLKNARRPPKLRDGPRGERAATRSRKPSTGPHA